MINLYKKLLPVIACGFLLIFSRSLLAAGFFPDEEVLWESGINLFVKLTDQESFARGKMPNDHPVELDDKNISIALESMKIWEKGYLSNDTEPESLFTIRQTNLLGRHIALGLKKATPEQDLVFALQANKSVGMLGLRDTVFTSGRAFYKDGKLNIIVGEFNRPRDKGLEAAYAQTGTEKVRYNLDTGSRRGASSFDEAIIKVDGVDNMRTNGKVRRDWLVIDVNLAAQAYIAQQKAEQNPQTAEDRAMKIEAAKLAQERREMRLEMARLRKEMDEKSGGGAATASLEERLKTLDTLKEKGLVTQEEYDQKREEILKDI